MATNITFNSNDLQTASIITSDVIHESSPSQEVAFLGIANANKSVLPFLNFPSRSIRAVGSLRASSIANLDALIDTFKGYFNGKDKNLDIDYDGGTRRYIATASKIDVNRPRGLAFATFDITFTCTEPFGRDTATTSALSVNARTSSSYTDSLTINGTAPYMLPVITIVYNTVTGGDNYVSVSHTQTGQGINIVDQTFVDDDVLVIDCLNKKVTVNDVEVNFIGAFPELPSGSQDIAYSDGFTTRNFDIDIDYYPLYL